MAPKNASEIFNSLNPEDKAAVFKAFFKWLPAVQGAPTLDIVQGAGAGQRRKICQKFLDAMKSQMRTTNDSPSGLLQVLHREQLARILRKHAIDSTFVQTSVFEEGELNLSEHQKALQLIDWVKANEVVPQAPRRVEDANAEIERLRARIKDMEDELEAAEERAETAEERAQAAAQKRLDAWQDSMRGVAARMNEFACELRAALPDLATPFDL